MTKNRINFKDDFYKTLMELVVPIVVQLFMMSLVSVSDTLMLGAVNQTALSAASLAGQVQFILSLLVMGMGAGCGIMAAQYFGKGDNLTIEKVARIALRINLIFGVLFMLAAWFFPNYLMMIFTSDSMLIASGAIYLHSVAPSYLLFSISHIYEVLLRNTGFTKISSRIASSAVIVNIVLNSLLIFGLCGFPRMGIAGAAIATTIARAFELTCSIIASSRPGRVGLNWLHLFNKTDKIIIQDFIKYTGPALGAYLVWGVAFSLYTVILGHLGEDAVAANSIVVVVKNILSCVINGVAAGAGIMIGNVLGSGDLVKAKDWGDRLARISFYIGLISGALVLVATPFILKFAPLEPQAQYYLKYMLIFTSLYQVAFCTNCTLLNGIFCAGGDSKFDMVGNVGAMWCFGVPLGFLAAFVFKWPLLVVYVIINLDEIVKLAAVIIHGRKYVWLKNITRDEIE